MSQAGLPLDQARLRPHLRRVGRGEVVRIEPEQNGVDMAAPSARFAPSPEDLRGVPIVGDHVREAMFGTSPELALIAKERRPSRVVKSP